jgi:hypothetical protein
MSRTGTIQWQILLELSYVWNNLGGDAMPNGIKLQKLIVVAMSVLAFVLGCTAPKEVVVHESPVCEWSSYLFRVEAVDAETGLGLSVCRLEYSLALHDSKGESLEIFVPVGDFDGRGVVLFLDVTSANNVGHPAVLRVSREGYHPEKRQLRFEKMRATQWFTG